MYRLLILFGCAIAGPAAALDLKLTGKFDLNYPSSLDYDPAFCGLWIANEGPEAILITLDGLELRRISSDLSRIKAISIEGDNLIVADGFGSFQRVTKDGRSIAEPFRISSTWADTEGITVDADGTLITVEDDPEYLTWLSPSGEILKRIDTMTLTPPLSEAQGIARDPRSGHLLIVDDWEGTNSLYEFDAEGRLLATAPLIEYGVDPEGIAIRPGSNQLFIAFDSGGSVASFEYTPTLPEGAEPLPPGGDCMMM
jgi:DNA-binding beta-propeller fold protein YncE